MPLIKKENLDTDTYTQGEHHVHIGDSLSQAKELPEAVREAEIDPSLVTSEGAWLY